VNELVQKLTQEQRIIASLRPEPTLEQLKAAVDRKYVLIKFTETRGGTELGIRLDPERSDLSAANFETGAGKIHIAGDLVLDYVPVRFHGDIDLATLDGTGRLEVLEGAGGEGAQP
jgi:core binding factor beta subunit